MNFKTTFLTASLMTLAAVAHAAPVAGKGTWETTLKARDLNNDGKADAFYDTQLNITWLAAGTDTLKNWADAKAWAEQDRFGLSGWRLPSTTDKGAPGCQWGNGGTDCGYSVDTSSSEMAHLFYVTLGNTSYYYPHTATRQPGYGLQNTANFANLQGDLLFGTYWSGTSSAADSSFAWVFYNHYGTQYDNPKAKKYAPGYYALAVRNGDVMAAPVPEPETYALMLAGLAAVGFVARRRKAA